MNEHPSANGFDGDRDPATGRFRRGNSASRGNPLGGQVSKLRAALIEAVSEGDMREVAAGLIKAAKAGDVAAAKVLLTYTLGKPIEHDLLQRIEALEENIGVTKR